MILRKGKGKMLDNATKGEIEKKIDDLNVPNQYYVDKAIDIIRFATEQMGFLIQTLNMGEETTGMILVDEDEFISGTNVHRLIVVKKGLPEEKIRFIVAHELGHFLLKNEGVRQLAHRESRTVNNDPDEQKMDYFARCFLMPQESVELFVSEMKDNKFANGKEKIVKLLAVMFNVSIKKAELRYNDLYN